jgi:exonuclease 3'-5' domain-containing protein 1
MTTNDDCVEVSNTVPTVDILGDVQLHDTGQTGLIDTPAAIASLVDSLSDLPNRPPSIYIDLEGINLSRHGTISILQLHVLPADKTYLIDVHTLGQEAFSSSATNGQTLKTVLESETVTKAFFDIRNDSDALFSLFGIKVAGISDIQLMELATRSFSKRLINGLAKCMGRDLPMTPAERLEWNMTKERGLKLFAPERGGSYEVFNVRPLSGEMMEYCKQDVQYLPRLWLHYSSKMNPDWEIKVEDATRDRIRLSQSAHFQGKGQHMALGPWN